MTNWPRGGYAAGNTPASELKPPPPGMVSKETVPADEGCTGEGRGRGHTYTASEVKVLTETASKVAYALGRKDAGEEIAAALERRRWQAVYEGQEAGPLLTEAVTLALGATSQSSQAASDATSGVPGHPEVSEAVRSPQERCGNPRCLCNSGEATT